MTGGAGRGVAAEALGHGEESADGVGVGHVPRQAQVGGKSESPRYHSKIAPPSLDNCPARLCINLTLARLVAPLSCNCRIVLINN